MVVRREIDLPRPRDLEVTYTDAFTDIVHELRGHIGAVRAGIIPVPIYPPTGLGKLAGYLESIGIQVVTNASVLRYDGSPQLQGDNWDATMNYAGFMRPVWTWLLGDDLPEEEGVRDDPRLLDRLLAASRVEVELRAAAVAFAAARIERQGRVEVRARLVGEALVDQEVAPEHVAVTAQQRVIEVEQRENVGGTSGWKGGEG